MKNQTTIKNKKLLGGEVCLSGNASFQPVGEFFNKGGKMKNCILCSKPTEGSIGVAGIKWSIICQECKDKEDKALETRIMNQAKVFDLILETI